MIFATAVRLRIMNRCKSTLCSGDLQSVLTGFRPASYRRPPDEEMHTLQSFTAEAPIRNARKLLVR